MVDLSNLQIINYLYSLINPSYIYTVFQYIVVQLRIRVAISYSCYYNIRRLIIKHVSLHISVKFILTNLNVQAFPQAINSNQ